MVAIELSISLLLSCLKHNAEQGVIYTLISANHNQIAASIYLVYGTLYTRHVVTVFEIDFHPVGGL